MERARTECKSGGNEGREGGWAREGARGMLGKRGEERKMENKGKALRKRNLSSGNNEVKSHVRVTVVTLR